MKLLFSLGSSIYKLKTPIPIKVESDSGYTIVSIDEIELFSYSVNESKAIKELCHDVIFLYEDLVSHKSSLGSLPKAWLSYLRGIIKHEE